MAEDPNKDRIYSIHVLCRNCGREGVITEKYGTSVSLDKHKMVCPGCGCSSGWKTVR